MFLEQIKKKCKYIFKCKNSYFKWWYFTILLFLLYIW